MSGQFLEISLDARALARSRERLGILSRRSFKAGIRDIVVSHGYLLYEGIIDNASGRPGPEIQTGTYVMSWMVKPDPNINEPGVQVMTMSPYSLRLEYGFSGVDSLGRRYDQPPFPHVRPAIEVVNESFRASLESYVEEFFK